MWRIGSTHLSGSTGLYCNLLGHALRRVIDVSVITVTPLKLAEDIRNLDPLPNFHITQF